MIEKTIQSNWVRYEKRRVSVYLGKGNGSCISKKSYLEVSLLSVWNAPLPKISGIKFFGPLDFIAFQERRVWFFVGFLWDHGSFSD